MTPNLAGKCFAGPAYMVGSLSVTVTPPALRITMSSGYRQLPNDINFDAVSFPSRVELEYQLTRSSDFHGGDVDEPPTVASVSL